MFVEFLKGLILVGIVLKALLARAWLEAAALGVDLLQVLEMIAARPLRKELALATRASDAYRG